ncbi:MAG: TIGR00266 family protein [Deltaproteobacteria bacterium]|nr:TIGR00266 family protein [Deltaproteobacteria bacterium]
MQYEILYDQAFPMIKVQLEKGETIKAESDAMVSMSATIDIAGKMDGGLLKGLTRKLSGESMFFQTLTATRGPGEALLTHAVPGGIHAYELDGTFELQIQKNGYLASTSGIEVTTSVQNVAKGLFSKAGFFILKAKGRGIVFLSCFGAIHPIRLGPGEERIIDNGHLVAWPATMNYKIEKAASGIINSLTSGEMLVCRFTGPGDVLIQSKNPSAFKSWVALSS